jgi:hypothetical protein
MNVSVRSRLCFALMICFIALYSGFLHVLT